jgi:hypothetical protein
LGQGNGPVDRFELAFHALQQGQCLLALIDVQVAFVACDIRFVADELAKVLQLGQDLIAFGLKPI